ncbi:AP-1 complex subunit sigma-2 isoform X1 [Etheostoma cragini]|uniref:AP-1 complex subunit sigma-2 isoform X1 n=1 Tax=Etheostoma cragini TaxID=417921 RepID=UPI00155F2F74|nr:AP-1 complex subunit sigma-2 isoform X1 [Etheostoma cragini]XP_034736725.1 AP-1 complex subunit sigma-2 isoform X1 [Etheostoma cragini]
MQFMLLFSRQGKLRLQKWYVPLSDREKKKITRELVQTVLARKPKMCSFLEWRDLKIVYKRYASLYFCCAIEDQDNELITLEIIHRYVELLDKYFGSVCELDIIFNFEKAYFILDEFLLGGEAQETSKKNVLKAIEQADLLQENLDFQMRLFAGCQRSRDAAQRAGGNWPDINTVHIILHVPHTSFICQLLYLADNSNSPLSTLTVTHTHTQLCLCSLFPETTNVALLLPAELFVLCEDVKC